MKTFVAISLSMLVFFQSAGLDMVDIFLFGRFVKHVEYHSENYDDDFFTFFEKHYGALKTEHQKNHQDEEQEHQKLPFQHISSSHWLTEVILGDSESPSLKPTLPSHIISNFHYQNLYYSLEKPSVFQPPKLT